LNLIGDEDDYFAAVNSKSAEISDTINKSELKDVFFVD
jgi:hypothetical protein